MSSLIWLFIILIHFINFISCETIIVTVGERGLFFSPQNITARANDVIKFTFFSGKHQIVQSDGPAGSCVKSSNLDAFASGLQEGGDYTYIVPQSQKIGTLYYFCAYSSHCAYGMWGTINIDHDPPSDPDPDPVPDPIDPPYATEPTEEASNEDNLPIIIGSAIGGFFTLSILGLIAFMLYRRKKYQKQFESSMQPYDPKGEDGGGGNNFGGNDLNHVRGSTAMASVSTLDNITLTRSNTSNRGEPNHEVVMQNNQNQPYEQTIRSYDERTSMEHGGGGIYRGSSKRERESSYHKHYSDFSNAEGSRSPLSPPPQYDNEISYQQQQQQPPIPPRPTNIAPAQFGAPYVPPRPIAVSRYPPQYGPSIPVYQEPQYNISPDAFGPANPGQNYHQQPRQPFPPLIPLPSPPPTQPPSQPLPPVPSQPLQPIPPPPSQQQTGQYFE